MGKEWRRRKEGICKKTRRFAKRFLHPDIVSKHAYIFLWDENLGVENFNAGRWVEMMAPVFSRALWRCAWKAHQTKWYVPKLAFNNQLLESNELTEISPQGLPESHPSDATNAVWKQSLVELERFKNRWKKAAREDQCWVDPFQQPMKQKSD
ncbi:hypothetical protein CQW23_30935 [Capsicum baccatum]|uniref:Uncharacterized protein n=1 Tax=Capsicum baccatum TaxID=33114 RepID=A0A2G2V907_CAPBA|nr:hypothetical protein CQW23_30935 [Capsicum baccatum]